MNIVYMSETSETECYPEDELEIKKLQDEDVGEEPEPEPEIDETEDDTVKVEEPPKPKKRGRKPKATKDGRPKGKVGRPKKYPPVQPEPKKGVVDCPKNESSHMEFVYNSPFIFKKLWAFFKLMAVNKIHFSFQKDCIYLWCQDHLKKSNIQVKINCNEITHYFCKEDYEISMLCKNPDRVMTTINKHYGSIFIVSSEDSIDRNIDIVLNNEMNIEERHQIELTTNDTLTSESFSDEDYCIKFKLPSKYFKKLITDLKQFSTIFNIRQDGKDEPLIFEYITNDKKVRSSHIMRDNAQIALESKLFAEDDMFRIGFKLEYVRPLASAYASQDQDIQIFADENKPLLFIMNMDNAVEIRMKTEIINNNTELA